MRRRLTIVGVLATALAIALAVVWTRENAGTQRTSLAQLVAKNYRTFTPAESRRLVRFAQKEYECVTAQGAQISAPRASRTRIVMRAPGQSPRTLVHHLTACDKAVGPPPLKSTLQARPGQVLVYFPKWCLLDPRELP